MMTPTSDQLAIQYDEIRACLVARGALKGPHHWDQIVARCRKTASSAHELVQAIIEETKDLPGAHDQTANPNPK